MDHPPRTRSLNGCSRRAPYRHRLSSASTDSDALDRCDPSGKLRSPGHADGSRPGRLRSLARFLRFDPNDPIWPNRLPLRPCPNGPRRCSSTRCAPDGRPGCLSATMRWSVSPLILDDIKFFRQSRSKCPGHPEYRWDLVGRVDHRALCQGMRHPSWGWPSPRNARRHSTSRASTSCDFAVNAFRGYGVSRRGVARGGVAAGPPALSNLCWVDDTTTISSDGPTAARLHGRRPPPGSWGMAERHPVGFQLPALITRSFRGVHAREGGPP